MIDKQQALEIIDKLDFFNDRAGRELWNDKPKEIQDEDIRNAHEEYKQLKEYVLNQPKVGEWIPVEERLPEEKKFYEEIMRSSLCLVTVLSDDELMIGIDRTVNGVWTLEETFDKSKIIAWLPLPEPYSSGD